MVLKITSTNSKHFHTYNVTKSRTGKKDNHDHKINLKRMLALPNKKGGHSHKLLNKKSTSKKKSLNLKSLNLFGRLY